jgi:hypothetical protein
MLDFVAFPLAVLALPLNEYLLTGNTQLRAAYDLLLPYLVGVIPLTFGGFAHQMLVMRLPASWSLWRRRILSVSLSPMILGVFLLMMDARFLVRLAMPILIGLLAYNITTRLPPDVDVQLPNQGLLPDDLR